MRTVKMKLTRVAYSEFVSNVGARYAPEAAQVYQCPVCVRPIFTQYEGKDRAKSVDCGPDGHTVTWGGRQVKGRATGGGCVEPK